MLAVSCSDDTAPPHGESRNNQVARRNAAQPVKAPQTGQEIIDILPAPRLRGGRL